MPLDGKLLEEDGKPLDGKLLEEDGKPLDGKLLEEDGKLLDEDGKLLEEDEKPFSEDAKPSCETPFAVLTGESKKGISSEYRKSGTTDRGEIPFPAFCPSVLAGEDFCTLNGL